MSKIKIDYELAIKTASDIIKRNPHLTKSQKMAIITDAIYWSSKIQRETRYLRDYKPLTEKEIEEIVNKNIQKDLLAETFCYYIVNAIPKYNIKPDHKYSCHELVAKQIVPKYVMDAVLRFIPLPYFQHELRRAFRYSFVDINIIKGQRTYYFMFPDRQD